MSKRKTNVEKLREIRDKMNEEVEDMTEKEFSDYIDNIQNQYYAGKLFAKPPKEKASNRRLSKA
ncbi:hypothetical protein KQY10_11375 [Leptospira interrogans]|uniref:Uncharacterized protein n=4 Tax=Leptospira interrogans TaxID=173 RepID=M6GGK8_LEPIR|nr:hypothetical protein [Leptospira interrogans]EMF44487.1 hypothetical protein LEP1GSC067_3626 [Leptospira interrogans serovar Lora str. TE 1992]EMM83885.1 hypothetical protein LEP1GSC037_4640 [Leptospira interrogans str. 2006001854]KAA1293777.1 hypothetical protein C4X99_01470 [Leptospira interrogans serovar Geyaweera]ALE39546.1 hypothetical protein G436_2370 [Leptospira interrogans serovar Hardjo str. Norma]EKO96147.1 hypothetical protein LEP1GSC057_1799 [Leptospira interrogans str. Brem 32